MKTDLFKVRRRFAKLSLAAILLTLFSCLGIAFWGDENAAARLREAGIIVAPIVVCLTGIIGQYAQLVFKQDTANALKVKDP